ncbi:MAG: hypothetical protein ACJAUP_002453 [Cellvibrionaceae bacterium]|jgi:hypothetical protein
MSSSPIPTDGNKEEIYSILSSVGTPSISKLRVNYEAEVASSNAVYFDAEVGLRKFLEYIGSESVVSFVDFSEEIKGGDRYISIGIEFINEKEILFNNHVMFIEDSEELGAAIDKAIFYSSEGEDNDKNTAGMVYIVESENRLKLLIKFQSDEDDTNNDKVVDEQRFEE